MSEHKTSDAARASRLQKVLDQAGVDYTYRRETKPGSRNDEYVEYTFSFNEEKLIDAIASGKIPLASDKLTR